MPPSRAIVLDLAGSRYGYSVLSAGGAMAGVVMMGMPAVLLEPDGTADPALASPLGPRPRVKDSLAAVRDHLVNTRTRTRWRRCV